MLKLSSIRQCFLWCTLAASVVCPRAHASRAELKVQSGHSQTVTSAAFSPDGRFLLTAGNDKSAGLWEIASAREIRRFEGHTSDVACAVFSPDGLHVLTASSDGTARLWDRATAREIRRFQGHAGAVTSAAFSADGRFVATGGIDKTARLWEMNTGREVRRFEGHAHWVLSVAFSPNGRFLLTGGYDNTARLWEVDTGRELYRFSHSSQVPSVSFSPDGRFALTASWDGTARLWDTSSGREAARFGDGREAIRAAVLSPDGRSILTAGDTATEWDAATGRRILHFALDSQATGAAASPDSLSFAVVGLGGYARTFERSSGREIQRFEGRLDWVVSAAFSPDGRSVLTASWDHLARIWNLAAGGEPRVLKGHTEALSCGLFSPNGRFVLTTGWDATTRLWDRDSGREIRRFAGANSIAFSPDSRSVLTNGPLRLWDMDSGRQIRDFPDHSQSYAAAAFSADGRFILTGGQDQIVHLWDAATGAEIRRFEGHAHWIRSVAFAPDGRTILSGGDYTARLWDVATGREIRRFEGHTDYVDSVAFSPDGLRVVTSSYDKTARLWDVTTGREIHRLAGQSGIVASAAFSADGRLVVTASFDGTTRIWNSDNGALVATLTSFRDGGWAVVDAEGRYDASDPDNSPGLYWELGDDVIELKQLKARFYTPDLLARALGFNPEPLPRVAGLNDLQPWPAVRITAPAPGRSAATIRLTDRGGGIGRVVVRVNGREIALGARGQAIRAGTPVTVDLSAAELLPSGRNTIEVIAYDKANLVAGRGVDVPWEKVPANATTPPTLHAIVAGVSSYGDQSLSLRFPAKDAYDMAHALEIGGARMFGVARTEIALFATGAGREPTKENIRQAFASIPSRAGPSDVMLVYLAGHGVAGRAGSDLYFYLTRDARTIKPEDDEQLWESTTISSGELLEWLGRKGMPLNQVIVLDTCAAGAATGRLIKLADRRELTADQRRAIELLKDANNGSHILMGAAADKVSYEANRYGQGLLTYSLLLGMRGEALDEGGRLDVERWFHTAQLRVPELAQGIGGIQQPVIRSGGQTFPIALFTPEDRTRIQLSTLKPQLLRAAVHDDDDNDPLQLDEPVRAALRSVSIPATRGEMRTEPPLVYLDQVAGDVADAYIPQVRYQVSGNTVQIRLRLVSAGERLERKFESSAHNPTELAKRITEEFLQMLAALRPSRRP